MSESLLRQLVKDLEERRGGEAGDVLHPQHGEVVAGGGADDGGGVLGPGQASDEDLRQRREH